MTLLGVQKGQNGVLMLLNKLVQGLVRLCLLGLLTIFKRIGFDHDAMVSTSTGHSSDSHFSASWWPLCSISKWQSGHFMPSFSSPDFRCWAVMRSTRISFCHLLIWLSSLYFSAKAVKKRQYRTVHLDRQKKKLFN